MDYVAAHRHPTNQLTHKIAIPFIVFHIIAMLDWIKLGVALPLGPVTVDLSLGHVAYVGAIAFYVSLHAGLAMIMAALFALCFPLGAITPKPVVVGVAVVAWAIQLAGHSVWEKNRPAFFTNLLQALIGPFFFVALLTGVWHPRNVQPAAAE